MKIEYDYEEKVIEISGNWKMSKLLNILNNLPDTFSEWHITSKVVVSPFSSPVIQPLTTPNPYDTNKIWYTHDTNIMPT